MIGRAGSRGGGVSSTDDEISIGVGKSSSLDTLRLASGVATVVLALLVRLKVVGIALTAGVDELLAVSGLGVEPPAVGISSAVSLLTRQLTDVLWSGTADTAESRRS